MKTDLQDVTDTRKTLAVTLEANEVEAEEKSLLDQFSKMAKIPGFRPGKAPLSIVRQKHAKDIAGELKQRVMAKAYQDGSKEAKVELVNVIDVQESEIVAGQDITVTFTIDVRPEFTVENFKGLELQGLSERSRIRILTKRSMESAKKRRSFLLLSAKQPREITLNSRTKALLTERRSAKSSLISPFTQRCLKLGKRLVPTKDSSLDWEINCKD